jgi:hypothetical protein
MDTGVLFLLEGTHKCDREHALSLGVSFDVAHLEKQTDLNFIYCIAL